MRNALFSLIVVAAVGSSAMAQTPYGYYTVPSGTSFQNTGGYHYIAPGVRQNVYTGSTHVPGVAVHRSSGSYYHVGNGYYRNPASGNIYSPRSGSYSSGKNLSFSPGSYQQYGATRVNHATGSVHIPGRAVIKRSGVYHPIGNTGYYRNPTTGNMYNPYTQAYKTHR